MEPDPDLISELNKRIRRDHWDYSKRDASRTAMDSKETEKYNRLMKKRGEPYLGRQKSRSAGENSVGETSRPTEERRRTETERERVGVIVFKEKKIDAVMPR